MKGEKLGEHSTSSGLRCEIVLFFILLWMRARACSCAATAGNPFCMCSKEVRWSKRLGGLDKTPEGVPRSW